MTLAPGLVLGSNKYGLLPMSLASITRRQFLKCISAAPFAHVLGRAAFAGEAASLGEIALANGVLYGTAYDRDVLNVPSFSDLYVRQARIFTSNNFLKFGSLRPAEDKCDYAIADALINFALERGIQVRGHNLIWNDWTPEWLQRSSADRVAYWLDRHVDETVTRYAGRLHSWDVVNEPLWLAHGNDGGYRSGPWFSALGKSYIASALKRARAADPSVKLVINESGPEWQRFWDQMDGAAIRKSFLRLIDELQHDGVPLDAVGLQCHWMPDFEFSAAAFQDLLHELASRHLAIYLTEIDVSDAKIKGNVARRDEEVARRYELLISTALKVPEVKVIQTWELSDNATWLRVKPHLGPGGRLPRPLLFDDKLQPKAAYDAMARALAVRRV